MDAWLASPAVIGNHLTWPPPETWTSAFAPHGTRMSALTIPFWSVNTVAPALVELEAPEEDDPDEDEPDDIPPDDIPPDDVPPDEEVVVDDDPELEEA
jgi:hypothetical protein